MAFHGVGAMAPMAPMLPTPMGGVDLPGLSFITCLNLQGEYEGEAVATDQNKERIFCIHVKLALS